MKDISVIGVGYVGLVTGACFADLGNRVVAVDIDAARIAGLQQGQLPIYEPGLKEVVARNVAAGRLSFTTSYTSSLQNADFAFIAVATPASVDGDADLQYVQAASESIAREMVRPLIVVNKSTVPVGTGDWVAEIIRANQPRPIPFSVVSCPEFLREGSAILDFMNPARVVLGSLDEGPAHQVAELHLALRAPIMITDLRTAEMIKYASNAFLATKISFINEIANICEALGADVKEVARGMGYDPRIGAHFLEAGLGYGGSCFPKDVAALAFMAADKGRHPALLQAVMDINADRRQELVDQVTALLGDLHGRVVGLLGLSFKPNTDDMREAPSLEVARLLTEAGARLRAYDPVAMPRAAELLPDVEMAESPYALAKGVDALVVCTEWNEFKQLDLERIREAMRQPVVVDGRNLYEPADMLRLGFRYRGIGRGSGRDGHPLVPAPAHEAAP